MALPASDIKLFMHDTGTLLHARWRCILSQGVMLALLGTLAIALPVVTTLAIDTVIGWLLLSSGVWRTIVHVRARHSYGFGWYLATALMSIVLGASMLLVPHAGMKALTGLLFAFFVLDGMGKIHFALDLRHYAHEWGWAMTSGMLDLALAGLILAGWPATAAWALGLLVGLNMLFFSVALIVTSLAARRGRHRDLQKIARPDFYVSPKESSPAR